MIVGIGFVAAIATITGTTTIIAITAIVAMMVIMAIMVNFATLFSGKTKKVSLLRNYFRVDWSKLSPGFANIRDTSPFVSNDSRLAISIPLF